MTRRLLFAGFIFLVSALSTAGCGGEDTPPDVPSAGSAPVETTPSDHAAPTFTDDAELRATATGRVGPEERPVTLHWPEASDDTAVVAYLVSVEGGSPVRVASDVTQTQLQGISFDTPRRFSVRAVDEAGNESEPLVTSDALAPQFPEGALVQVERAGDAYILRWPEAQDDVGVVGYTITRGEDEVAALDADTRTYRAEDMSAAFTVQIAALDAAGHKARIPLDRSQLSARSALDAVGHTERMLLGAVGDGATIREALSGPSAADLLGASGGGGGTELGARFPETGGGGNFGGLSRGRTLGRISGLTGAPAPTGTVSLGPLGDESGDGVLDAIVVTRALRRQLPAFESCYRDQLRRVSNTLGGRIEVQFTVTPEGVIDGERTRQNNVSPDVGACVLRAVRRMRFNPGPEGGSVTFAYPLAFMP